MAIHLVIHHEVPITVNRRIFAMSQFEPHQLRSHIHPGQLVDIVLKKDQPTGKLTRGTVGRILTNSPNHWRGIKVMLDDGQVGRVQAIIGEEPDELLG